MASDRKIHRAKELGRMKIQLPNGEQAYLDESLTKDEKKAVAQKLSDEWRDLSRENWNSNSIKYFLDTLANYLVWHKEPKRALQRDRMVLAKRPTHTYVSYRLTEAENCVTEKGQEDKYVLSRKKMEMLVRYKKTSKATNFTDLTDKHKEILFGERGME
jgi:hypothetical protein